MGAVAALNASDRLLIITNKAYDTSHTEKTIDIKLLFFKRTK